MKILLVHNRYQFVGGEDAVFESEGQLLSTYGHTVDRMIFDNREISGGLSKWMAGIQGIYNRKSARRLQDQIDRRRPDIIHVHNFVPLASPSVFYVAARNSIPAVLTLHNYRLVCPSATLFFEGALYTRSVHRLFPIDAILKGVYRGSVLQTAGLALMTFLHNVTGTWRNKVAKFIVLTKFAREVFIDSALRVRKEQFAIKPNFLVDPGLIPTQRTGPLLYVGRLSAEKGIVTLLEACTRGNFELNIIGDGPDRPIVDEIVKKNPNIRYLGFQQKEAILKQLRACTAMVFPSVCFEGFPITILEALATGTPVIASRTGGIPEIIRHEENGLLFQPGDIDALIAAIRHIKRPGVIDQLSMRARQVYAENYTPQKNYETLMDIYRQAMVGDNLKRHARKQ
jgi:glycosyltransferase involved in cell wall biosynthesis